MGKLVYLMNVSLDGFVETPDHSSIGRTSTRDPPLVQRRSRETDAFLYGRRLYEVMNAFWRPRSPSRLRLTT